MKKAAPLLRKIKSPAALVRVFATLRRQGKKIVFTNGVFDIIHPGHVRYLEKAAAQGDILVVAINSDSAVKKLKGPTRPINALADRMQVIAALASVDFVTQFSDETPLKLILKLHPDVLVKGGDWKVAQIAGGREVKAWGGQVKSLSFIAGKSTTQIIAQAKGNFS